jgi:hypothetical protein
MKTRLGFISNSSSSSFVVISIDNIRLWEDGSTWMEEESGSNGCLDIDIDNMIKKLQEAKEKGAKTINIYHGGGYNG